MKNFNESYIREKVLINEGLLSDFWNWLIGKSNTKYDYWDDSKFDNKEFNEIMTTVSNKNVITKDVKLKMVEDTVNKMVDNKTGKSVFDKVNTLLANWKSSKKTEDNASKLNWLVYVLSIKSEKLNQIVGIIGYNKDYIFKDENNKEIKTVHIVVVDFAQKFKKELKFNILLLDVLKEISEETEINTFIIDNADPAIFKEMDEYVESISKVKSETGKNTWKVVL